MGERLGTPCGVLILDDTGFPKKGSHSAGVGRQYSGTLGRVDNCQVRVFLGYASTHGHTLVDRRLYLTESWLGDPVKRRSPRAAVPADVGFRTKLDLAAEMLTRAAERGHLPYAWVTADAAYGDSHDLRRLVAGQGRWYCFEVRGTAEVWTADPVWQVPPASGRAGRRATLAKAGPGSVAARDVAAIVRSLPDGDWVRHRVTEGEKGPREYEFVRLRVIERIHREPGPEGWLMARRPVGSDAGADIRCYLSNALAEMAAVGCLRWTIEEDLGLAKGEVGLDHYEVTRYRGWYHHITLSLMALAFLCSRPRQSSLWSFGPVPRRVRLDLRAVDGHPAEPDHARRLARVEAVEEEHREGGQVTPPELADGLVAGACLAGEEHEADVVAHAHQDLPAIRKLHGAGGGDGAYTTGKVDQGAKTES